MMKQDLGFWIEEKSGDSVVLCSGIFSRALLSCLDDTPYIACRIDIDR